MVLGSLVSEYVTLQRNDVSLKKKIEIGAGWGGCTVSLVEEARVPEFIEKLKATYPPYHGLQPEELSEIIFATRPSSGASGMCTNSLFVAASPHVSSSLQGLKNNFIFPICTM